jgi:hypothetical protein
MKELFKVAIWSIVGIFNRDYNKKAIEVIQKWDRKTLKKYMVTISLIYIVATGVLLYILNEILG